MNRPSKPTHGTLPQATPSTPLFQRRKTSLDHRQQVSTKPSKTPKSLSTTHPKTFTSHVAPALWVSQGHFSIPTHSRGWASHQTQHQDKKPVRLANLHTPNRIPVNTLHIHRPPAPNVAPPLASTQCPLPEPSRQYHRMVHGATKPHALVLRPIRTCSKKLDPSWVGNSSRYRTVRGRFRICEVEA
jgi:hypothetical protein